MYELGMIEGLILRARKASKFPKSDQIEVVLCDRRGQAIHPAKPLEFEENAIEGAVESHFTTTPAAMQPLFDDLWKAGLRPSEAADKSGVIAAKDLHIVQLFEIVKGLLPK